MSHTQLLAPPGSFVAASAASSCSVFLQFLDVVYTASGGLPSLQNDPQIKYACSYAGSLQNIAHAGVQAVPEGRTVLQVRKVDSTCL